MYAFGVEPNWLERTFTRVKMPCKRLASGVRILQLSDFHASPPVPFSLIENSVELGLDAKPDVICLTGDFVTDATPFDEARVYARPSALGERSAGIRHLGQSRRRRMGCIARRLPRTPL